MTNSAVPPILGRLYQSDARNFTFTCAQANVLIPKLGDMVIASIAPESLIYGVISNIRWQSDDLIFQLARTESDTLSPGIISDNQLQRYAGPSIDVLHIGFQEGRRIIHALPPRPPLSLEKIRFASPTEQLLFTSHSFTYLRLILEAGDQIPLNDVLVGHLKSANQAQISAGNNEWFLDAVDYLIDMLANDYDRMVAILEVVHEHVQNRPSQKE